MGKRSRIKQKGFSLTELVVVLAITSVVAVGTSAVLLDLHKSSIKMNSQSNMMSTMQMLTRSMARAPSSLQTTRECSQIVSVAGGGSVNTGTDGRTEVVLEPTEGATFQSGTQINSGNNTATINSIYLESPQHLSTYQGESNWLARMFMTVSMDGQISRPRSMGTLIIKTNSANQLIECNGQIEASNERDQCEGTSGWTWNSSTGECDQSVNWNEGAQLECPSGTSRRAVGACTDAARCGVCVPQAASCPAGQILKSIATEDFFIARSNCEEPPLHPAVGMPASGGTYTRSPATSTIAAPRAPRRGTISCNDPNVLDQQTYDACAALPGCLDRGMVRAPDGCGTSATRVYNPPSSAPSVAPPVDDSCLCNNNNRIAEGEYCMYCVRNIDLGYGSYDYTYGVAQCRNGALVQVNASMAPNPLYCEDYSRARCDSSGNCTQIQ